MLVHPQFDPVAIHLGPFGIHWYGLMYLLGFITFIWLGRKRLRTLNRPGWDEKFLDDLLFYGVLGVVLGARLGQVLFYEPGYYFSHPLKIIAVWEGGMSFHGGFIGVMLAMALFARKRDIVWLQLMDFIAPLVPLGLGAGRIGNFINGELWGRVADPSLPWAVIFPGSGDMLPRHPSQLYQFALEGLALFAILWVYSRKPRVPGTVGSLFLIAYGVLRIVGEMFKEPEALYGAMPLGL